MHEHILWILKRALNWDNWLKKMKLLTKQQQESYENAKMCYICKDEFEDQYVNGKKYCKVRNHCHYAG